jgi:hypothetical protein
MTVINERLWIENGAGAAKAHRVVPTDKPRLALVGDRRQRVVPVRKLDRLGDGTVLVPAAELADAAPLSPADVAQYDRLDAELAGSLVTDSRKMKAFNALRLRALVYGECGA